MQASVSRGWREPDIFHNVDLAARWPAHRGDVVSQHPESRPHSLAVGNLDASLHAAVLHGIEPFGFHASRGIYAGLWILNMYVEMAETVQVHVFGRIRVCFEFVVPAAVGAEIVRPVNGVR